MPDSIRTLAVRAIGSVAVAATLALPLFYFGIAPSSADVDESSLDIVELTLLFFGLVLFSPLAETLLFAAIFKSANVYLSSAKSMVVAAVALASLHGLVSWAWGVAVFIPFLIFGIPFMRQDTSLKRAILASAITHAFHNSYAFILIVIVNAA